MSIPYCTSMVAFGLQETDIHLKCGQGVSIRKGFVVDCPSVMQVIQRFSVQVRASFDTDVVVESTLLPLCVKLY